MDFDFERLIGLARKVRLSTALTLALLIAVFLLMLSTLARAPRTMSNEPPPFQGYTLVTPLQSTKTYLIDLQGRVLRTWNSAYRAGQTAYLLENGHLLRACKLADEEQLFAGAGAGGRVQEFTWEGEIIWDIKYHNETQLPHHDVARMPDGNVLLIVWEIKTAKEAIAAGRRPDLVDGPWLVDSVVEIKPTGRTSGEVVWEWHAWDHLIQDHDSSRANYGQVAAHPELLDVNFSEDHFPVSPQAPRDNLNKLRSLGYVGSPAARGNRGVLPDWTHVNAVAYNAELDQIMLTARSFNEFWIIDHSTTSAEAASHTGGRSGKGGDLLYRWGNPQAYRAGTKLDQRLFAQHDAHWIPRGRPGEGHVLVFNNGVGRPEGDYSSVDEIVIPVDSQGRYVRGPGAAYGPRGPVWRYTAPRKGDFFAWLMSGAQRLPNGNTLICDSVTGKIFEATPSKVVVWTYTYNGTVELGPKRPDSRRRAQAILGEQVRDHLKATPEKGVPRRTRVDGSGASPTSGTATGRNPVFRAYRYGADYPGVAGKEIHPGKTVEELESAEPVADARRAASPGSTPPGGIADDAPPGRSVPEESP